MCTVLLQPGDNPIAVNKYTLPYQFLSNKTNAAGCSERLFKATSTRYEAPAQLSDRTFNLPDYQAR